MAEKTEWDSSIAFIFAMIGAAVGLGNIWRFSYVLYSNGGGSFFIPYFTAIAIMGIPFLILEYGVGFSFKDSFSNIMKKIKPQFSTEFCYPPKIIQSIKAHIPGFTKSICSHFISQGIPFSHLFFPNTPI